VSQTSTTSTPPGPPISLSLFLTRTPNQLLIGRQHQQEEAGHLGHHHQTSHSIYVEAQVVSLKAWCPSHLVALGYVPVPCPCGLPPGRYLNPFYETPPQHMLPLVSGFCTAASPNLVPHREPCLGSYYLVSSLPIPVRGPALGIAREVPPHNPATAYLGPISCSCNIPVPRPHSCT
jgi:hypothetical protein